MQFDDRPQIPLTPRRMTLVAAGGVMFVGQLVAAAVLAAPTTGPGDADPGVFALLWAGSVLWSVGITLCIIRQADIADVFTAALLVTIGPYALYALLGALDLRGTRDETDIVSAMFLGITVGALTAVLVWGIAMAIARLLRMPMSADGGSRPPAR
jgi:hypothetical protein